jgi:hypothetical protein
MIKTKPKKTYPNKLKPVMPIPDQSIPFKIILEDRVINRDGSVFFFKN